MSDGRRLASPGDVGEPIGAEVTVYEAYDDPAGPVGSYVSLAVNGLRALDVLECLTRVQVAGFLVARHRMWSGSGRLLGDVARGRRSEDPLRSVTLMRADLVSALRAEALRSGARIVTGQRLDAASDPRAADADLIVGADGIWSATRRALDPAAPQPSYAGLYSVSGTSGSVPTGLPGKLAKMETSNRDAKTAGLIGARMREMIMPHVISRFYEKATGGLYDFDPGAIPAPGTG